MLATFFTNDNGDKFWHCNFKIHREDGPAIERADGTNRWYLNGKQHREDGPAVEFADGSISWFLHDIHYSFDEWLEVNTSLSDEEKVMMILTYG